MTFQVRYEGWGGGGAGAILFGEKKIYASSYYFESQYPLRPLKTTATYLIVFKAVFNLLLIHEGTRQAFYSGPFWPLLLMKSSILIID
jgi:hypothetical protein